MPIATEFRQVIRRLLRSPMFTAVTILTIAIGIGANSAVFSVVNGILLKPLPYADPGALIAVWQTAPRINLTRMDLSPSDFFTFRDENRSFQKFGLWNSGSVAVTGSTAPEQVRCIFMTQGTLDALGIQPALGRWFTAADDDPASAGTAILTHDYWQRKFGGDSAVLGAHLVVDGKPTSVAGVMPPSFRFLEEKPDLILPM
ncbi:MAG TPA: ABC transporter permease, partial [Candidatus Solibacter sp.]